MTDNTPIETERKFLIAMPSAADLESSDGLRIKYIEQTYLLTDDGTNARVRKISENGQMSFVKTVKKRISVLSCYEDEREISLAEYEEELKNADPRRATIVKTRYAIPCGGHTVEIDVYPFWNDRATLEVELQSENEPFCLPEFVKILKEVSNDKRYKNTNLAMSVPYDTI